MRLGLLLFTMLVARFASAQVTDTSRRSVGNSVSGVVHDSIARKPLEGAVVQLVAADSQSGPGRSARSDSLGRFAFADVPVGRYTLGFFHPMLDSLGIQPMLQALSVNGQGPVHADLAIPSPLQMRIAICGPRLAPDSSAVVVGFVRDAQNLAPIAGVTVTGRWFEVSFKQREISRRVPRVVAATGANGWFALCDVPGATSIALIASRGGDTTDVIEAMVPETGFLRRELYLGSARSLVTADTIRYAETPALIKRRTGDGRLSGMVVTSSGGSPVKGAQVRIPDGPETVSDARGSWTLLNAPAGTRMLEIRAVGYSTERRAVDVISDAAPIYTILTTTEATLDTVKVTASRVSFEMRGFELRRRGGAGRFLTAEDIVRRDPTATSDLFIMVPGLSVERSTVGETTIRMRGTYGEPCMPSVHIDGAYVGELSAGALDAWVTPDEVAGIEIYDAQWAPPQFTSSMGGTVQTRQVCGSIVIWTKPRPRSSNRTSWKRRVATVLGAAALGLLAGELFRKSW